MRTQISTDQDIQTGNNLWSLAKQKDFASILTILSAEGTQEEDLGERLLALARQAISAGELGAAKEILFFLIEAIEDQSEAPPLLKLIGDIYALEEDHKKAREYYGKLPLTLANLTLSLTSFVHELDIDGLLSLRNNVVERVAPQDAIHIHAWVDKCIQTIARAPQISGQQLKLYNQNLEHLTKIYPFSETPDLLEQFSRQHEIQDKKQSIITSSDAIYIEQDGIWDKFKSNYALQEITRKSLQGGENLIIRTSTPNEFFSFANALGTESPQFIKFECWIIIDFKLLQQVLSAYDLGTLLNCNYVIRLIDETQLEQQLTNLLLVRNLIFPHRALSSGTNDQEFIAQKIQPIISRCEKIIKENSLGYEKHLAEIFPENFHEQVLTKIREGKKLKILFQSSRFTTYMQYSSRDMAEGFRQLGHETFIELEEEGAGVGIRTDICMKNLIEFQPDILFNINHFRHKYPWIPKSIPYATWVQDLMPHITSLDDPNILTARDHIFSFSNNWYDHFFKKHPIYSKQKLHILQVTASSKIYRPLPEIKKIYDVTFVTHLYDYNLTLYPIAKGKFGEKYSPIEQQAARYLVDELENSSFAMIRELTTSDQVRKELLKKVCTKNGLPLTDKLLNLVHWLSPENKPAPFWYHLHLLMKTKPVSYLLQNGVNIKVFGKNWEKYPTVSQAAMGAIENGAELNKLFNQSRINLNASPGTSYHMKVPEVIASKSFMLTGYIPTELDTMPIEDFFEKDKEIIIFKDENDLLKKVQFYLINSVKREAIATIAYEKYNALYSARTSAFNVLQSIAGQKTS